MAEALNLGCGEFKKSGYLNVDYRSVSEPDVRHDLNRFPYPFEDSAFSLIEADHLLEHLDEPFKVMRELHRIAKPGGVVRLRVPHFSRGFTHAEHQRGFDVSFPLYFNPAFQGGYQGVSFRLEKIRLRWFAQPYLKRTLLSRPVFYAAAAAGWLIDVAANLSPWLCSRVWCFWVGGFEEVEFVLRVEKAVGKPLAAP
jgi:SAM-dependent methyltransferase